MSRRYSFVTIWHLDATIEPVWDAIVQVEHWPQWWPCVLSVVSLEPGSQDGLGAVNRLTWRGRLPYTLTFDMRVTERVRHHRLVGVASGDLHGSGVWVFESLPGATRVQYDWHVGTTKAWMNALAPLLKPAFRWNHDYIMRVGGQGLAKRLQCRLRESEEIQRTEA